jgi:ubiquinone/menaquinone biosynthesis C-methylase UbiE
MSPLTWDNLYSHHPDEYETLVSHEDYQGSLLPAVSRIQPLSGTIAAEFGCGTGRVTSLLAKAVQRLHAFDLSAPMLRTAQGRLRREGSEHASLAQADSRKMPVRDGWADFAIEGWAFLQIAVWHWGDWQAELGRALDEMQRIVRPGGKSILIETLGTGETTPKPAPNFRKVYDWLETEHGFHPEWTRTDYRFESMEPIRDVVVPLFGEGMLEPLVSTAKGFVLPECTGLWWR